MLLCNARSKGLQLPCLHEVMHTNKSLVIVAYGPLEVFDEAGWAHFMARRSLSTAMF
jgi:hypothetical protein